MTIVIFAFVLTAAVFGLRFNVFMIVPVIVVGVFFIGVVMIARGEHTGVILAAVLLNAVGIQIGYLCGTFARALLRDSQTPDPTIAAAARPTRISESQVELRVRGQLVD